MINWFRGVKAGAGLNASSGSGAGQERLQSPPGIGPFAVLPECWLLPLFSTYVGPSDYILPEGDANSSSSLCPTQKPSTRGPGELAHLPWVVRHFDPSTSDMLVHLCVRLLQPWAWHRNE